MLATADIDPRAFAVTARSPIRIPDWLLVGRLRHVLGGAILGATALMSPPSAHVPLADAFAALNVTTPLREAAATYLPTRVLSATAAVVTPPSVNDTSAADTVLQTRTLPWLSTLHAPSNTTKSMTDMQRRIAERNHQYAVASYLAQEAALLFAVLVSQNLPLARRVGSAIWTRCNGCGKAGILALVLVATILSNRDRLADAFTLVRGTDPGDLAFSAFRATVDGFRSGLRELGGHFLAALMGIRRASRGADVPAPLVQMKPATDPSLLSMATRHLPTVALIPLLGARRWHPEGRARTLRRLVTVSAELATYQALTSAATAITPIPNPSAVHGYLLTALQTTAVQLLFGVDDSAVAAQLLVAAGASAGAAWASDLSLGAWSTAAANVTAQHILGVWRGNITIGEVEMIETARDATQAMASDMRLSPL
jgi:hypothetical protein